MAGKSAVREAWAETLTAEIGWIEAEFATNLWLSTVFEDAASLMKPSLGGRRWESPPRPGREQKIDGRDALIVNPSIESDGQDNTEIPERCGVLRFYVIIQKSTYK